MMLAVPPGKANWLEVTGEVGDGLAAVTLTVGLAGGATVTIALRATEPPALLAVRVYVVVFVSVTILEPPPAAVAPPAMAVFKGDWVIVDDMALVAAHDSVEVDVG